MGHIFHEPILYFSGQQGLGGGGSCAGVGGVLSENLPVALRKDLEECNDILAACSLTCRAFCKASGWHPSFQSQSGILVPVCCARFHERRCPGRLIGFGFLPVSV